MRPTWKGFLAFGLVNIPVTLHAAVQGRDGLSFRQLHGKDLSPIRYRRVCEEEGVDVPWAEIVKGYEYEKGKFVVLTDEDFKAAAVESSKALEIRDFVPESEIDPRFFETPYYLVPQKGGEKAYALLREAIRRTGMVGIGTLTMRANAHHLVGVKVLADAIVLEVMRFESELVDASEFNFPAADQVRPQEVQMAEQLIGNLAESFEPGKYADEYHDNLRRIIQAKLKGKKVKLEEPSTPEKTKVIDLMARLQESIARGKTNKSPTKPATKRANGSAPNGATAKKRSTRTATRSRARKSA
jgi:DNA end-binding protein Ku